MVELLANSGDPDQTPHSALVSVFWFFFFFFCCCFFITFAPKLMLSQDLTSRIQFSQLYFSV